MELSSSEDDFVVLSFLEKRKYWVNPILKTREEKGEFHLLQELRNYPNHSQV